MAGDISPGNIANLPILKKNPLTDIRNTRSIEKVFLNGWFIKPTELKPWKQKGWVIPPGCNSEFVASMEQVLDVYNRPYALSRSVICMDESHRQLIAKTRQPHPMVPGWVARFGYEYRRCSVCSVFVANEPLTGLRIVKVFPTRTKVQWAHFLGHIADNWLNAERITLVMDNLNTHSSKALFEAFPPHQAKQLQDRFEFVFTPKLS